MRIVIIGAGSVGTNLHHALEIKGVRAELVHARPLTADPSAVKSLPQADCYIYTVVDHVLEEVISKVNAPKALHLHTSGSMPIEVFGADKPHAGILSRSSSRTGALSLVSSRAKTSTTSQRSTPSHRRSQAVSTRRTSMIANGCI